MSAFNAWPEIGDEVRDQDDNVAYILRIEREPQAMGSAVYVVATDGVANEYRYPLSALSRLDSDIDPDRVMGWVLAPLRTIGKVEYRRGLVTIDSDDEVQHFIPCWIHATMTWNGFMLPLFAAEDIAEARAEIQAIFGDGEDYPEKMRLSWSEAGIPSLIDPMYAEGGEYASDDWGGEHVSTVDADGETLYSIGEGFVWQEPYTDDDDVEPAESIREWLDRVAVAV